ncbi:MAG: hypothetical protein K6C97_02770 [Treponema sp.]|nr:hypothetical protein [Treponema sp.]
MIFIKRWIEYYDSIFSADDKKVKFFQKLAEEFPETQKFLSIECGTGNLSLKLAQDFDITSTDTQPEFVTIVKDRTLNLEKPFPIFNLNPKDLGKYLGKNFYNIIYSLNYRILFTDSESKIINLLKDCNKLLTKDGYFVIEILTPPEFNSDQGVIELPRKFSVRSTLFTYITKTQTSNICKITQTLKTSSGKVIEEVIDEPICFISKDRMEEISKESGYSSITFYHDYDCNPTMDKASRIICLLKK